MKKLPNYLTILRIVLIPVLVLAFYIPGKWGALISGTIFIFASVTDFFDGYLARRYDVQSNFGRWLDPVADKLLVATAIIMLVHFDKADIFPAIAILCREILVSGLREYLAEINVSVPVSKLAKIKTAIQMTSLSLLLLSGGLPDYFFAEFLGSVTLWIAAGLTVITGYAYLKTGLVHMDEEEKTD